MTIKAPAHSPSSTRLLDQAQRPNAGASRTLLSLGLSTLLALIALGAAPALAEDEREPGWYDSAELSLVSTSGNSEATTFGFKNLLERLWTSSRFSLTASGLRAESDTISRFAVGTPSDFQVIETSTTTLTAENYSLNGRYQRNISETFFWFAGAGWERNEFAGFDSRTSAIVGAGNRWWEAPKGHFDTDYGVTYTQQDDLVKDPSTSDSFLGLRLGANGLYQFNDSTSYKGALVIDQNLDDTDDLRADVVNSIKVSMTDRLALQLSHQLLYDKQPALAAVSLVDAAGLPTGTLVSAELDTIDSILTAALVISF